MSSTGEITRSYRELDGSARRVARRLREQAVIGDRALLLLPPGAAYVESFWGCLYAGVVAVPAYPPDLTWLGRSLPRLRALVADCGARVALTTPEVARAFGPGGTAAGEFESLRWLVDATHQANTTDASGETNGADAAQGASGAQATADDAFRVPALDPSALALLQYTSGSTGQPKGVMVTHGNLLHNAELVRQGFETSPESTGVIWLPPYHDMGLIGGIVHPIYTGFPVVLTSPLSFLRRPMRWLELVSERGATVSGGPDFAFDLCVRKSRPAERARLDLSRWQVAFCGAEPVRAETLDRFAEAFAPAGFRREAFYPCYGLAEGTLAVSGGARAAAPLVRRFGREARREGRAEPALEGSEGRTLVSCGRALGDQRVVVVDPATGRPSPEGCEGEIWVSGPSVAAGYWGRPDESRATFEAQLASPGDQRAYLRTGDLGFWQAGELFVSGRQKDLIIVRGQNHHPSDLERSAEGAHPALRPGGVAAFAVGGKGGNSGNGGNGDNGGNGGNGGNSGEGGEGLGLACELAPGALAKADEALAALRRRVAEEHEIRPRVVLLLKAGGLPRTSSGKVQRQACRRAYEEGTFEVVARYDEGAAPALGAEGEGSAGEEGEGSAGEEGEGSAGEEGEGSAGKEGEGSAGEEGEESRALWRRLRERLAATLGLAAGAIAADEPIVRYGLDSLRAAELEGELEAAFGVEVPGAFLLRGATLRQLAERLEAGGEAAGRAQERLQGAPISSQEERLQGAPISSQEERLRGAPISLHGAPIPGGARTAVTGAAAEAAARVATEAAAAGVVERPASEGQRALWFLQRLAPESDAYHVARAFRLLAPPDVGALGRALDALVFRHASLRASFPEREGVPVERVGPRAGPSLQVVDARGWGEDELARRLGEAARQPFDLAEGPLFRAQLFERAEGARLLFCFHHLVIDFGSLGVLAGELGALYEAARGGQEPSLPPAGVTPAEFERARGPKGDEREALRRYWRGALAGAPPVLDVPTDRPRPRRPSFVGARLPFSTSAEVAARVKVLAGACDTTVFTTLLAAFALFLHTYTGERDLVVGTPSAGRRSPLVRRSVGYFVNPLTLRLGVDPAQSFRELVRRTRGAVVEALEHGALPFAQLIEALRPAREPGRAPLVQVMFAWQSSPAGAPELGSVAIERAGAQARLGGLELESLALERQGSAFDLSVMMAEGAEGLGGSLEYRSDLFDPASAEAMARHFVALLAAGVGAPDAPVGQLSPLDEGDRRQLRAWAGAAAIASNAAGGVLHRLFEARAAETPGAPALSFRGQTLSYRELDERANRLAHRLRELGVGAEVRVGVCLERGPDVAIAFWAVLKAGGAYVPLDPGAPPERLGWTAADAGLRLVVTRGEAAARLSFVTASLLRLEQADEAAGAWPTATPSTSVSDRPDSLAYVIYTSGSTGTPKGVMVTHRNAANLARAQRDRLELRADDRVAQYCPSNFDISIWDTLMAHLNGACLLPTPAEAVPPGPSLVSYFEGERVSVATMLPSVLAALPRAELPALRLLVSGAEVCTPELVERWAPQRTFFNAYGPTEITVCCAFDACTPDGTMPPIGRPVLGATAYVLNEAFEPAPVGAAGELYIGGRGVARGYLGRPALSAERFLPDPFSSEPGARLYKTGDRARWNRRGRLEFLGRLDEQIKLNGFRIEPAEIEARLRDDLGAREAVVLATPGPSGRTRLVAYVSAEGGRRAAREVRARLRARLPEYMLPSAFVWLEALPLMPNGKIDRRALAAMNEAESGPEAPFVAPRDGLETSIAGAWAEALGRARAGVREHFFEDLGGGSLDVVKVCALLAERLGREVPLTHLFEHPTVEGLAERLRRDEAGAAAPGAGTARAEGRAEARRAALARRGRRGG